MKSVTVWSWAPHGCFIPRQTDRLTLGRNITLTLTSEVSLKLVRVCILVTINICIEVYYMVVSSSIDSPTHSCKISCSVLKQLSKAHARLVLLIPTGGYEYLTRVHALLRVKIRFHLYTRLDAECCTGSAVAIHRSHGDTTYHNINDTSKNIQYINVTLLLL
jgi:hypothetical protein